MVGKNEVFGEKPKPAQLFLPQVAQPLNAIQQFQDIYNRLDL
jgi:hypothetical protein